MALHSTSIAGITEPMPTAGVVAGADGSGANFDLQRVGTPETFPGSEEKWPSWSFVMRGFLVAQGIFTRQELQLIERWGEPIPLSQLNVDIRKRAEQCWYVLLMKTSGNAQLILQNCEETNGVEAWRKLARRYDRAKESAAARRLYSILSYEFGNDLARYLDNLALWEAKIQKYDQANPLDEVADSVKKSILIHGAPQPLRDFLEVSTSGKTYAQVKASIIDYMQSKQDWGSLPSVKIESGENPLEPKPMDVSALDQKGKKGKGKGKGKKGKGKSKGKVKPPSFLHCRQCGRTGHLTRDCEQNDEDMNGEEGEDDYEDLSGTQCYYCWGWGHRARNCSSRARDLRLQALEEVGEFPCFNCMEYGHKASKCPQYQLTSIEEMESISALQQLASETAVPKEFDDDDDDDETDIESAADRQQEAKRA